MLCFLCTCLRNVLRMTICNAKLRSDVKWYKALRCYGNVRAMALRVLIRMRRARVTICEVSFTEPSLEYGLEQKIRLWRESSERWRSQGTCQPVVHAGRHVLCRVRFDRSHGNISDRRETRRKHRRHRRTRGSQKRSSITSCAWSSRLRRDRSKYLERKSSLSRYSRTFALSNSARDFNRFFPFPDKFISIFASMT